MKLRGKLSGFLTELKRRRVARVALVYAMVGLGVIEGTQMILPTVHLEAGYPRIVLLVLFGFPIAVVLAWAYAALRRIWPPRWSKVWRGQEREGSEESRGRSGKGHEVRRDEEELEPPSGNFRREF